jgi:hypothetical protein
VLTHDFQDADAENIGYVIPTPVVEHFTTDTEGNKQYTGFPSLGIEWQKMESQYLRMYRARVPDINMTQGRDISLTMVGSRAIDAAEAFCMHACKATSDKAASSRATSTQVEPADMQWQSLRTAASVVLQVHSRQSIR